MQKSPAGAGASAGRDYEWGEMNYSATLKITMRFQLFSS